MYKIIKHCKLSCIPGLGTHILSCNDTTFFLHFFSFFCFCNETFFHSGYVIKPPQPSSAFNRALSKILPRNLSQKYFPEISPSIWTKVTQADSCLAQGFSNFFSLHPHFQKMCCYATPLICSLDQLCRPTAQSRVLCGPVMFSLL